MTKPRRNKIYAVYKGLNPGLYYKWSGEGGCEEQVKNYEGAIFKSFKNISDAKSFLEKGPESIPKNKDKEKDDYFPVLGPNKPHPDKEPIIIYVDGSAKKDKDGICRGGYGVIYGIEDKRNFKEPFVLTNPTNNRCEVMACIRAIQITDRLKYCDIDTEIVIATDSEYVINAMTGKSKWKLNKDLLQRLYNLTQKRPVAFYKVKAHQGVTKNPENELADKLAYSTLEK